MTLEVEQSLAGQNWSFGGSVVPSGQLLPSRCCLKPSLIPDMRSLCALLAVGNYPTALASLIGKISPSLFLGCKLSLATLDFIMEMLGCCVISKVCVVLAGWAGLLGTWGEVRRQLEVG